MPEADAIESRKVLPAVTLNNDQAAALEALIDFIQDADPANPYYVLQGFAGTGKTFLMKLIVERCAASRIKFAFTAPTNKATKVLKAVTGAACTIYALLGLRIDTSGEIKELVGAKHPIDLSDIDIVFIDEGSMVSHRLKAEIGNAQAEHGFKVIFLGDPAQLPPVGEPESPIWRDGIPTSLLNKVMRHDNEILQLVTAIREQVNSIAPCIQLKSNNSNGEGVWKMGSRDFRRSVYESARDGQFVDGNKCKVIAWRNVRVAEYNNLIREAIFGSEAAPGFYLAQDRIIATAPIVRGDDTLMNTDDEAIVISVVEGVHYEYKQYKTFDLKVLTETGRNLRLCVLHPDSQGLFESDCTNLAHEAKRNSKLWKKFWALKDTFDAVKYAYAITAHRSQGSTYETVFVDYQDILLNRNRREAFQCLYVACSRPTKRLILA